MSKVAVKKLYTENELDNEVFRRARCILSLYKDSKAQTRPLCVNALRAVRSLELSDDEVAAVARQVAMQTLDHA